MVSVELPDVCLTDLEPEVMLGSPLSLNTGTCMRIAASTTSAISAPGGGAGAGGDAGESHVAQYWYVLKMVHRGHAVVYST